jgi:DnaJ-class molecular chaperone
VKGEGQRAAEHGDLYLRVHLQPHPRFAAKGRDLHTALPVVDDEAVLGGEVPLTTLTGGQLQVRVPPASQAGKVFRLKGKGLPALKDGLPGDLYATLEIRTPETITPAMQELYERLRKERTGSS